ncbi:MAG: SCO2322 family protein, partial [Nocardioidaceae bacterium]
MTPPRRIAATFITLVLTLVAALAGLAGLAPSYAGTASTAQQSALAQARSSAAGDGYTYWAYFTWDASGSRWELAPVGANDKKIDPKDGDVFGFRWALNVGTTSAREPRADGDFAAICGSEPATGSGVQIAFVIDYGTATDAPKGQEPPQPRGICIDAKSSATVQQALQAVTPVRTSSSGLLCAIDNYPASGCGDTVK